MLSDNVPQNEQNGQDGPTLDEQYVALPGHPFYGRRVQVVGRRVSRTYTRCIIEDPAHPGFHYHIFERWLSTSPPPPEPPPVTAQTPIAISLFALDNLVQMIVTKIPKRRNSDDTPSDERNQPTDLGATAEQTQDPTQRTPLLPGPEAGRRNSP
jgi:hypothetical protein